MSEPSLLGRLKERKIVQWAIAYLAGAWVLVEATGHVVGLFQWPVVVTEVVTILAFFGLFVALVIAWYHGEKGRQWVSGPELLIIALLLLISGGVLSMLGEGDGALEAPATPASVQVEADKPAIAVLPFDDFSPNPDDAYFANGMHEEIISKLSKIAGLRVISRNSVMQYRENKKATPQVALELGVDFVLEGSARVAGDQVRLTAQLIDARRDEHLWQDDYDQELSVESLISTQSDIAQRVARAVGAALTQGEQRRIGLVPTENLEAYENYMRGLHHLGRRDQTRQAFSQALGYFQLAIQQDPDLAVAHAGLSGAYASMAMWGHSDPRGLWPLVEQWSRSALAIDSTVGAAHAGLAAGWAVGSWDWERTERGFQRATELSPNDPGLLSVQADFLMGQGRIEEGLERRRIATALDPLSSLTLTGQAIKVFHSRRYEEADELIEVLLERDPGNTSAAWYLALASILDGRLEQVARISSFEYGDPAGRSPGVRAHSAVLLSLLGEADSARFDLERAVAGSVDEFVDPNWVWPAYTALGEEDEAFRWMERSIEVQSYHTMFLGVTPLADPLRDDPRYQAILDRIGLGHLKERFDSLAAADPRGGSGT
jgi:serine/threonine-protein kinase